mmetsp:Transcript_44745/g.173595  ORF Transcript_44745/g.173595 Transcript_44745/m.173595 type:complete len:94 (+) Transcript_44745:1234-1515(+)
MVADELNLLFAKRIVQWDKHEPVRNAGILDHAPGRTVLAENSYTVTLEKLHIAAVECIALPTRSGEPASPALRTFCRLNVLMAFASLSTRSFT